MPILNLKRKTKFSQRSFATFYVCPLAVPPSKWFPLTYNGIITKVFKSGKTFRGGVSEPPLSLLYFKLSIFNTRLKKSHNLHAVEAPRNYLKF